MPPVGRYTDESVAWHEERHLLKEQLIAEAEAAEAYAAEFEEADDEVDAGAISDYSR